jgi:hypothetical protein
MSLKYSSCGKFIKLFQQILVCQEKSGKWNHEEKNMQGFFFKIFLLKIILFRNICARGRNGFEKQKQWNQWSCEVMPRKIYTKTWIYSKWMFMYKAKLLRDSQYIYTNSSQTNWKKMKKEQIIDWFESIFSVSFLWDLQTKKRYWKNSD